MPMPEEDTTPVISPDEEVPPPPELQPLPGDTAPSDARRRWLEERGLD